MKFHGISNSTFYLHLKESEFRFNYGKQNTNKILLKIIRNKPLFQSRALNLFGCHYEMKYSRKEIKCTKHEIDTMFDLA